MSPSTDTLITAEELAQNPPDYPCELVEGRIVRMSPAGLPHGLIAARLHQALVLHLAHRETGGLVVSAETGYLVKRNPDTVRAPDVAWVSDETLSKEDVVAGFSSRPPDLAVEVLSPDDAWETVEQKVDEYLSAGTRLVWVISPKGRKVCVYRPEQPRITLSEQQVLSGGEVLPGFSLEVSALFA